MFLTQALRVALCGDATSNVSAAGPTRDSAVTRAIELIRLNPEHSWTIDHLARRVGLSRSTFTAHFRAATDMSPISFLTRLRLGLAAEYLAGTTQTIDSIARRVGYDNRSSLSKAFARSYGCSPAGFRRDADRAPIVLSP